MSQWHTLSPAARRAILRSELMDLIVLGIILTGVAITAALVA